MNHIEYFKLQAKNLFKDYKTKTLNYDETYGDYLYEYNPKYFDIDDIFMVYDVDEENFCLMKSQHIIALIVGFRKWTDLLEASTAELELARLLFDNQNKIYLEDWEMYIAGAERDNNTIFCPDTKLEIFKHVFLNVEHRSPFPDYRLSRDISAVSQQ